LSVGGHKIERNATILVLTAVLTNALGLGLSVVVARMLGVENFGLLAFAYALAAICLAVPQFGFDRLAVRELARRPSRASRFLVNISAVKGCLYIPAGAACALTIWFNAHDYERLLVVIVVFVVMAIQQHIVFACSFFRAIQKMWREGLVRLILSVLLFSIGLAVLLAGFELRALVVSRLVVSIFCLGLAIFWIKKDIGIALVKFNWRYSQKLIRMSAPFALLYILVLVYGSLNLTILGFIKGDLFTGHYSAASKIIALLSFVPAGLAGASLPALSKLWKESHQSFHQVYQRSVRYVLLLGFPLAAGTFLLGEKAIVLLFGREFISSVPVLTILTFSLVPDFLNHIMSATLISMDRQKAAVMAALVGAIIALVSCFLFIPRWGAVGAAASLVLSVCGVSLCLFCALIGEVRMNTMLVIAVRSGVASGLMVFGLFAFTTIGMSLPVLVGASVPVYAGALLALGEVKFYEVKRGYELLRDVGRSLVVRGVPHEGFPDTYWSKRL